MKAVYITKHGSSDVLTYGDFPEPEFGPNEVLIRVRACALNRLDLYTRAGSRGTKRNFDKPHILGSDVAGDVIEIGADVTSIRRGTRVLVNPKMSCRQCRLCLAGQDDLCDQSPGMLGSSCNGGYAEYVVAPASNTLPLPENVTYENAAGLPTVFMPSWNILVRQGKLRPWETALIASSSSGVASAAIQIAKNVIGARVITTTSSEEKVKQAFALGADEVINYQTEDVARRIKDITSGKGVDVVVDHVGADFWPAAIRTLAKGGRYGICGVTSGYEVNLQIGLLFLNQHTVFGVFMGRGEDLRQIVDSAGRGLIRSIIHETYPLEDAARAHKVMEELHFFGKLVLVVP